MLDLRLTNKIFLTPSIGVGLYGKGRSNLNLYGPISFRSQIEIAYRFKSMSRIGLAFGHISNAGIGDKNPGVEILSIYYHVPLEKIFMKRVPKSI